MVLESGGLDYLDKGRLGVLIEVLTGGINGGECVWGDVRVMVLTIQVVAEGGGIKQEWRRDVLECLGYAWEGGDESLRDDLEACVEAVVEGMGVEEAKGVLREIKGGEFGWVVGKEAAGRVMGDDGDEGRGDEEVGRLVWSWVEGDKGARRR